MLNIQYFYRLSCVSSRFYFYASGKLAWANFHSERQAMHLKFKFPKVNHNTNAFREYLPHRWWVRVSLWGLVCISGWSVERKCWRVGQSSLSAPQQSSLLSRWHGRLQRQELLMCTPKLAIRVKGEACYYFFFKATSSWVVPGEYKGSWTEHSSPSTLLYVEQCCISLFALIYRIRLWSKIQQMKLYSQSA